MRRDEVTKDFYVKIQFCYKYFLRLNEVRLCPNSFHVQTVNQIKQINYTKIAFCLNLSMKYLHLILRKISKVNCTMFLKSFTIYLMSVQIFILYTQIVQSNNTM